MDKATMRKLLYPPKKKGVRMCEWCKKTKATWFFTRWGGFGLSLCDNCFDRNRLSKVPYKGPKVPIR